MVRWQGLARRPNGEAAAKSTTVVTIPIPGRKASTGKLSGEVTHTHFLYLWWDSSNVPPFFANELFARRTYKHIGDNNKKVRTGIVSTFLDCKFFE